MVVKEALLIPSEETSSISNLPHKVEQLPFPERELWEIQYELRQSESRINFPEVMKPKIPGILGVSWEEASVQIRTTVQDRWTKEKAVYNPMRNRRPRTQQDENPFMIAIKEKQHNCPFCDPENQTPSNGSGRIQKGLVISAANLTPFADFHELLIFDHNQYEMTKKTFFNLIGAALEIARIQNLKNPDLKFFILGDNTGYHSGASREHGHWQVAGNGGSMHFPIAELYNVMANSYRRETGRDFFEDKFKIHKALRLGWEMQGGVWVMAPLTPRKDHGAVIFDNDDWNFMEKGVSEEFKEACYQVLRFMLDKEGVEEFNIVFFLRPLGNSREEWRDFRNFMVFVDRGSSRTPTSDMGFMEAVAGEIVVEKDPFVWGRLLGEELQKAS